LSSTSVGSATTHRRRRASRKRANERKLDITRKIIEHKFKGMFVSAENWWFIFDCGTAFLPVQIVWLKEVPIRRIEGDAW
jgi:hypothetical protein